jgi:hypothetical protein
MNNRLYYWDGEKVIEARDWQQKYKNCFSVDIAFETTTPESRYGKDTGDLWEHIPFSDFPPEFKLQLLLLGIS